MSDFDVVIAGGGAVGCTLALALAQTTDLQIAIVEAQDLTEGKTHPGFDARAVALARQSLDFLKQLNVAESIEKVTVPIKTIHVSDKGHLGQCTLKSQDYHVAELGRVIELQDLGQILHESLQQFSGRVTWFCPNQIQGVTFSDEDVMVSLEDEQELTAKLLVIAEGGKSHTRGLVGLDVSTNDYQQSAIIANVQTSEAHQNTAYERFTKKGPVALLPMTENRCSLVWTVDRDEAGEIISLSDETFLEKLQKVFGYRLGLFSKVGKRFSYPLALVKSEKLSAHRSVVLGNASQTLHPIAGQGFNLGLRDVQGLVSTLSQCSQDNDCGAFSVTSEYESARGIDRRQVIGATHGLVTLFSNDETMPVMVRNIGLMGMEMLTPVKGAFARKAMGLGQATGLNVK